MNIGLKMTLLYFLNVCINIRIYISTMEKLCPCIGDESEIGKAGEKSDEKPQSDQRSQAQSAKLTGSSGMSMRSAIGLAINTLWKESAISQPPPTPKVDAEPGELLEDNLSPPKLVRQNGSCKERTSCCLGKQEEICEARKK
jgi:hypothetical protein